MDVKIIFKFLFFITILLLINQSNSSVIPSLISSFTNPTNEEISHNLHEHKHHHERQLKHEKAKTHQSIKIASNLSQTGGPKPETRNDRKLNMAEDYDTFDVTMETTQVKDVISFVEFKMNEITSLIEECIDQEYENNPDAIAKEVKSNCVGNSYQIMFFNYNEGIRKVRGIFMEILKLKLQNLKEDYEDETNFFLDLLETLVNKDFAIPDSLEIAKKASKYYVSPRYFDRLVSLTAPEVAGFSALHERLKSQRATVQKKIQEKEDDEESYVRRVERKAKDMKKKKHIRHEKKRSLKEQTQVQETLRNKENFNNMPNLNQMNAPQYNIPNQPSFQTSSDPFIHKLGNQIDNLDLYRSVAMPRDAAQGSDPSFNMGSLQQENMNQNFMNKKT